MVSIPILLSNVYGIQKFGFRVNYPVDVLEYLAAQKSSLTQEFDYLLGFEEEPGIIRVGGEGQIRIRERNVGPLVILIFRVRDGEDLRLPLVVFSPEEDIAEVEMGEAIFVRVKEPLSEPKLVGFGDPVPSSGNILKIPILMSSLFCLKAFGFEIKYTQEKMDFLGLEPDRSGDYIALQAVEMEPGLIRVGGYRMNENLERGPGLLVELIFHIKREGGEISLSGLVDDIASALVLRGSIKIE
ncbi:MAG: hypothetical protein ACUVV5_11070 [Candidatus Aminicenantales bacterium]